MVAAARLSSLDVFLDIIDIGFNALMNSFNRGRRHASSKYLASFVGTSTNGRALISLPEIKYMSNAANVLINCLVALSCNISSPSINELKHFGFSDFAPVNITFIFILIK